jgi:hypothetical protein
MFRTSTLLFSTLVLAGSFVSAQELHNRNQAPTPSNPQEQNIPPQQQDRQYPADNQQPWAAQQGQTSDSQAQDTQAQDSDQDNQDQAAQAPDAQQEPQPLQPPAAPSAQAAQQEDSQPVEPPAAPAEERQTIARNAVARTYGSAAYPNEVPDGYRFLVTLAEPLDTASVAPGKHFRALLREPLVAPNGQSITGGHWVTGHVSEVQRGFNAMLLLSFDEIQTQRGWVPLSATVVEIPSEHGLKTPGSEGEIQRKPIDLRKTLEGAGVGAVVGASTGEAAGGSRGAAVGAATGAVTGAGVATLTDRNILLDRGAQLVLRLDRGVVIP